MRKTKVYHTTKGVSELLDPLADWVATALEMPRPEQSTRGDAIILRSQLTGIFRHAAGLVFELTIELTPTGDGFVAIVDNGDLRKQLAAMGIAWFFFWPMLITAGYGALANHQNLDRVLAKLDELTSPEPILAAA